MTVYTEDDGTEIDEDTFSAFDPGSTFICAVGNEKIDRYICYYCKDTVYKEK